MNTKTKLALAAALFVGTTSLAAAQGYDPNLANRYPALAGFRFGLARILLFAHVWLETPCRCRRWLLRSRVGR